MALECKGGIPRVRLGEVNHLGFVILYKDFEVCLLKNLLGGTR